MVLRAEGTHSEPLLDNDLVSSDVDPEDDSGDEEYIAEVKSRKR